MTRYNLKYPASAKRHCACRHPVSFFTCVFLLLPAATGASGQKAYLSDGKKKVALSEQSWIGLTAPNDTIEYWGDKEYSYYIASTGRDSLTVRRPGTFLDTLVLENDIYDKKLSFDYRTGKCFKENKVRYCNIRKVLSYETKSFAYRDLTFVTYSVYAGKMSGCIFCILIPGVNIWWLIDMSNRKEKRLDMKKWKILVE